MGKIYGSMKDRSASPIYREHLSVSIKKYFETYDIWNKGKKTGRLSDEHRKKISDKGKGRKKPLSYSVKLGERMKKQWKNPKFRAKMIQAISKANSGRVFTKEQKKRLSIRVSNEGNPRYIDGRTNKWKEVRIKCFQRDNYACQECDNRSSKGNRIYLQSHHMICRKKCKDIYDINNLITLCRNCHCKMTDIENTNKYLPYLKKFQKCIKMRG